MRNGLLLAALLLTGCVTRSVERPNYYSSNGPTNDPQPYCKSGPNGQTGACIGAMIITTAIDKMTK